MAKETGGNIDSTQIKGADRQGDTSIVLMFESPLTGPYRSPLVGEFLVGGNFGGAAPSGYSPSYFAVATDLSNYARSPIIEPYFSFSDITTANASTSKHGLCPKGDGNSAHFLDGTLAWSTPSSSGGGPSNQNDVTASRALETVYHNTGSNPLYVSVASYSTTGAFNAQAFVDASNPPTTNVANWLFGISNNAASGFFIVLPNYYYKVHQVGGGPTLLSWIEWS